MDKNAKPYPNEHSCRLEDPAKFDKFRRQKCGQKHDDKCIDVIYGIKAGKSKIQALRYSIDVWTKSAARSHCKEREGKFEAASKEGKPMNIEQKTIRLELKADQEGAFIARIATLNVVDKDGDITLPGAFPEGKELLVSAYAHNSWMGALPVGKAIIHEEGDDVLAEGEFNLNTETGREHYEAVKFSGGLQEWSYGFRVVEYEETQEDGQNIRQLKEIEPYEISPVLLGAGVDTATLAIKAGQSTFIDEANAVLAAAISFVDRSEALVGLRRKEGRVLSAANREKMKKLFTSLMEVAKNLGDLLDATEPVDTNAQAILLLTKIKRTMEVIEGEKFKGTHRNSG